MIEVHSIILGAGPAGLASAYELCRADKSVLIVEKNDSVGGLARTLQFGEFRTDIGPHRFYSQNRYLYDFIESILGEHWIKVDRLTRFFINGKFFSYPTELKNALFNVGPYKATRILLDFIAERMKSLVVQRKPATFEEQVIADFGRSLAELNMLNYTEKIWGLPCSEISTDWAKQRIKGLSMKEIIFNAFVKSKNGPHTLVDRFYYPDTGTGLIYEHLKDQIVNRNGILKLHSRPVAIYHSANAIKEVFIDIAGETCIAEPEHVVSSIPITEFVHLLEPKPPAKVFEAVQNLRFRSHVSLFVTLNKSYVIPDQWLYFPDKEIPFGRIMEPKNFSGRMSPPDKTSLLIEFFCWENDSIWKAEKEELLEMSLKSLSKIGLSKRKDVIECFVHREKYAYPLYDLNYKIHMEIVMDYLKQLENLHMIGRSGSFRYNNQDHALEMGIMAARSIIERRKYNHEEVGTRQEYFEKGYIS